MPDPHALNIARAVQREVTPNIVILFGSRATGKHHEDSDVDLLVISLDGPKIGSGAGRAASNYMNENPPFLDIDIVNMTLAEFQRNRRAKQHLAGQADHYGLTIDLERLDYGAEYEDDYPEHWPATRQRLENAAEWRREFNVMVDNNEWNQKLMGFSAEQAVENALRGLLSAHNDPTMFRHGPDRIWEHYVDTYHNPNDPETRELQDAVTSLLNHTTYENPESPTGYSNWLVRYAADYRYNIAPRPMERNEKVDLQDVVNNAIDRLAERIHKMGGTTEEDVFPRGAPWE